MSQTKYISTLNIPNNQRLIFALDVPSVEQAKQLVESLGDTVVFYKLGLELFMAGGYIELIQWLKKRGKLIFVDLKFFDVTQTVQSAVKQLDKYGATFATVHGNEAILKAAVAQKKSTKILAVTVLTSFDQSDIDDLFSVKDVDLKKLVLLRAQRAINAGCDGVISSGLESRDLRKNYGQSFIVVTPGVRPLEKEDDQKRTVNIEQAFKNGADYIVVGRPIKDYHGFDNPAQAAANIQKRIANFFLNATK